MKTNFISTLSILLVLSNIIGTSHFTSRFNYELLLEQSDSSALKFIELLRTIVLVLFTYTALQLTSFRLLYTQLIRFWTVFILARILNNRMITYGNYEF